VAQPAGESAQKSANAILDQADASEQHQPRASRDARQRTQGMRILITAPNSNIARKVLPELLAPEFSVRVIVCDPLHLPEQIREQVEMVPGFIDDSETLRRALEGVEALLWCVPPKSSQEANVRGDNERFALTACRAIREAGTPRVVAVSAFGNALGRSATSCAMEDILNQSGAAIRHLRCGWFMENLLWQARRVCDQGVFSFPMPGQIPLPMVATGDVADVVLKWLVRRDWVGIRTISMFGPEDISFSQAASIMARVLNRHVSYTEVSADFFTQELVRSGTSIHYALSLIKVLADWALNVPREQTRTAQLFGPTTLAEWTKRELLPMMQEFGSRSRPYPTCADIGKADLETLFSPRGL
jgi:uncharacterized protein YbjT (DUF2867 family)